MKRGIAVGGTIIVDNNKYIDSYPESGMLATVLSNSLGVGGSVSNVSIDLAKLDNELRVYAYGCIGSDDHGKYVYNELNKFQVNTDNVKILKDVDTAFTDVMTVKSSGERTFFTFNGANDYFAEEMIDFDEMDADIFHFGYPLLTKKMDSKNENYGTELASVFNKLQKKGIVTSLDLVSTEHPEYNEVITPTLKYCDYLIVNEIESSKLANINLEGKETNTETLKKISNEIYKKGFSGILVIHSPEGGWVFEKNGNTYYKKSFDLSKQEIVGTVGAGDAFCAGFLYSMYLGLSYDSALEIANATAASNLSELDSISGVKSFEEIKKIIKERQ